jgi:hypothetical protein
MKTVFSNIMSVIDRSRVLSPIEDLFETKPSSNQPSASARSLISDVLKNSLTAYRPPRTIQPLSSTIRRIEVTPPGSHKKSLPITITDKKKDLSFSIHQPLSERENGDLMRLSYRYIPEHTQFIPVQFRITKEVKRHLLSLSNYLGLLSSSSKLKFNTYNLLYKDLGNGVRSLANERWTPRKKLLEVLTYINGEYGRLIILVSMGVGCTVWYTFMPGGLETVPSEMLLFSRDLSYPGFYNINYELEPLEKLFFLESRNIADDVLSAFEDVFPFSEIPIHIPVLNNEVENAIPNNQARTAICLGIMVAVFLALGIVPKISTSSSTE